MGSMLPYIAAPWILWAMKMGGFYQFLQKSLQKSRIGNWENESHLQIDFSCFFLRDHDTLFG